MDFYSFQVSFWQFNGFDCFAKQWGFQNAIKKDFVPGWMNFSCKLIENFVKTTKKKETKNEPNAFHETSFILWANTNPHAYLKYDESTIFKQIFSMAPIFQKIIF